MRIAGFYFRPTLVPSLAFGLLLPMLLSLGFWQLDRAGQKEALLAAQADRAHAPALEITGSSTLTAEDRFRPAVVEGRFDPAQQWLLDNRVLRGRPGYHVFSLFDIDGGGAQLLVNRGWVALGETRQFLPQLPLPAGPQRLSGRLNTPASVGISLGDAPLGSIAEKVVLPELDIAALADARGRELLPLALVLDPDQAGALEYDWIQREQITPEKHLGYALQWFALALALLLIYVGVNTRRIGRQRS